MQLIDPTTQRFALPTDEAPMPIGSRWIVTCSCVDGLEVGDRVTVAWLNGRNFVREADLLEFPLGTIDGLYVVVIPNDER